MSGSSSTREWLERGDAIADDIRSYLSRSSLATRQRQARTSYLDDSDVAVWARLSDDLLQSGTEFSTSALKGTSPTAASVPPYYSFPPPPIVYVPQLPLEDLDDPFSNTPIRPCQPRLPHSSGRQSRGPRTSYRQSEAERGGGGDGVSLIWGSLSPRIPLPEDVEVGEKDDRAAATPLSFRKAESQQEEERAKKLNSSTQNGSQTGIDASFSTSADMEVADLRAQLNNERSMRREREAKMRALEKSYRDVWEMASRAERMATKLDAQLQQRDWAFQRGGVRDDRAQMAEYKESLRRKYAVQDELQRQSALLQSLSRFSSPSHTSSASSASSSSDALSTDSSV